MNKIVVLGHNAHAKQFNDLKRAASRMGVELDLCSYNQMHFDTFTRRMTLNNRPANYYDVYFFRNSKGCWEEVNLIANRLDDDKIVIDEIMRGAKPSEICKAYQMDVLSKAGISVPKTLYGSLDYLSTEGVRDFEFPLIIKGSKGDRIEQVFKVIGPRAFAEKISELRTVEDSGENRYMLQEYIRHSLNYRILVVGNKVLGVMSRGFGDNPRIRNDFNACDLPNDAKQIAVRAAKVCGIDIAGVDMVMKNSVPTIFEVNRTPSYDRFIEVTGVDVAKEVVEFLANVRNDVAVQPQHVVVPTVFAPQSLQPFVAPRVLPSTIPAPIQHQPVQAPRPASILDRFSHSPVNDTAVVKTSDGSANSLETILRNSGFKRVIFERD
jgi:glutathione synthase/RimK-type ligase-like ATP-grasp enzyme